MTPRRIDRSGSRSTNSRWALVRTNGEIWECPRCWERLAVQKSICNCGFDRWDADGPTVTPRAGDAFQSMKGEPVREIAGVSEDGSLFSVYAEGTILIIGASDCVYRRGKWELTTAGLVRHGNSERVCL